MKIIEEYEDTLGNDIEVFECENCGRQVQVQAGGDPAFCPCEEEEEHDDQ